MSTRLLASLAPVVLLASCGQLVGITTLEVVPDASPATVVDGGIGEEATFDAGTDAPRDTGLVDSGDGALPRPYRTVFVTSDTDNGIMDGVVGADARCAAAATRGKLGPGPWVAWLSAPGVNAINRITFDGPYRLVNGGQVVSGKAQLASGNITVGIDLDEVGKTPTGEPWVWTGTRPNGEGKPDTNCSNWSTNNLAIFGTVGTMGRSDSKWTNNDGPGGGFPDFGCQTLGHLYCFEL
jgi:hypothetical protein